MNVRGAYVTETGAVVTVVRSSRAEGHHDSVIFGRDWQKMALCDHASRALCDERAPRVVMDSKPRAVVIGHTTKRAVMTRGHIVVRIAMSKDMH
ncbi:hypothetical protein [Pendulispora albinea]|uniref:Uncharacterized protein n=1 Tax=Pendulispora albinea TaxID=2741071 RepID=A0ABZ2M7P8_9BACT